MRGKISAVIHTYNSEKYLERVLASVKDFDETVICDMYSTDRTLEIAQKYNCKIVFHEKCEIPEPARTFAIQSASSEWVLAVDSDEVIPEALRRYLYRRIEKADCPQALWIPHKEFFMGKFMHGDYPGYILRFFRREGAWWPPYVHDRVQVEGKKEYIPSRRKDLAIIHLANKATELRLRKINTYTENEVIKRSQQHVSCFKMLYATAFRFIKAYFIKGGFRDGKAGLVNAGLIAFYKFVTVAKMWESRVRPEDIDRDLQG